MKLWNWTKVITDLVLIDTSVWVQLLRVKPENGELKLKASALLRTRKAAWCNVVQLELWNGVRNPADRKQLHELASIVQNQIISEAVWDFSYSLASKARSAGFTVPATDILIVSCAKVNGMHLLHQDKHMEHLLSF